MIQVTKDAAEALLTSYLAADLNPNETLLRIGANSGGCSGWRWELETNSKDDIREDDVTFESNDISIVVNKELYEEIIGPVKIDYSQKNLVEQGFVFIRESGQQCGCGESFTPYKEFA